MMHAENAFPTQPDMYFPSYVPGAATWIYFLTRFIGFSEANCYLAQVVLSIACITSMFAAIPQSASRKSKLAGALYIGITGIFLCAINVSIYSLLVDCVLALVPLSIFIQILTADKKDSVLFCILLIETSFTALLKTSGLLFVLFICIAWVTWPSGSENDKDDFSQRCITGIQGVLLLVIPFLCTRMYISRSARIYGDLSTTSQGVTMSRYSEIFKTHSPEQIRGIIGKYASEIFLVESGISQVRLLWIALFLIVGLFIFEKHFGLYYKTSKYMALYLLSFTVIYCIGLLLTYLFSMTETEANANHLACLYRYIGTATIFISGIVLFYVLLYISRNTSMSLTSPAMFAAIVGVLIIGTIFVNTGYIWGSNFYHGEEKYSMTAWSLCKEYIPEKWLYNNDSYIVIYDSGDFVDDNTGKIVYVMQTYLRSHNIRTLSLQDFQNDTLSEDTIDALSEYDYLITLGDFSDSKENISHYIPVDSISPGVTPVKSKGAYQS